MLVRTERNPLTLVIRGTALEQVAPYLVALALWSGIVTAWWASGVPIPKLTITPFSLIGLALSIFLGFRNNACYDRWWEARKTWGRLVNTSRSLCRQLLTLVGSESEGEAVAAFQQQAVHRQMAFVYALKHHLRDGHSIDELEGFVSWEEIEELDLSHNVPNAIAQKLGEDVVLAWTRGWLDTMHVPVLQQSLTALTDIQGICERIKNTPVPRSYTILTHRIVGIYCISLPFGVVDTVGLLSPLVVLIVSYAFLGLDQVGTQLEDPFERDANDLPLSSLARTIEIDLKQRIGTSEIPPRIEPFQGVLL